MPVTAQLRWKPNHSASSYFIRYREKGSTAWIIPLSGNPTINSFYNILGLLEGTAYEFQITAECCEGTISEITTGTTACPPIEILAVTTSNLAFNLTWPVVPWAVAYKIEYKARGAENFTEVVGSPLTQPSGPYASMLVADLALGLEYTFQIKVLCRNGLSMAKTINGTIPCPKVEDLRVTFTANTANLSWQPGTLDQRFFIEYKRQSDVAWITFNPDLGMTNISIPDLQYNTTYIFRVKGKCGAAFSENEQVIGASLCPPIANLSAAPNSTDVLLTWTLGYPGQTVKIERRKQGQTTWFVEADNLNASSKIISNLELGNIYEFKVTGKCGNFEINSLLANATLACPSIRDLFAENILVV